MKTILVTGGTVFVSRFVSEYFVKMGYKVYVLNRGTKPQPQGVHWIQADRHHLQNQLQSIDFDVVVDVCAYDEQDILDLLQALGHFQQYIMISSSAVYPEYAKQPFDEKTLLSLNRYWQDYGINKIAAEKTLLQYVPDAYIIRPPYLYGPMNNVYREAFVFECANLNRLFYIPKDGSMKLQFFYIEDLCRFLYHLMIDPPVEHIFNVGNPQSVTIKEWVELCYEICHQKPNFFHVDSTIEQRQYFPFYDYEYALDVQKQKLILTTTKPLDRGLQESYDWYQNHSQLVMRKPLIEFIDKHLKK